VLFHHPVAEAGSNRLLVVNLTALRDPIVRVITSGLSGEVEVERWPRPVPRSCRALLHHLCHQLLQLSIEHGGDVRYFRIAELPEERGRPVVLHTGLAVLVLVEQHPQRSI
jgi:hypothetical protein